MVVGTHIAVAGRYDTAAGIAALVPFFLVSALLLLNQFPDVEADREAGRRHLPIVWGRPRAAHVFVALYALRISRSSPASSRARFRGPACWGS